MVFGFVQYCYVIDYDVLFVEVEFGVYFCVYFLQVLLGIGFVDFVLVWWDCYWWYDVDVFGWNVVFGQQLFDEVVDGQYLVWQVGIGQQ